MKLQRPTAFLLKCPRQDLNLQPTDYESAALTVELQGRRSCEFSKRINFKSKLAIHLFVFAAGHEQTDLFDARRFRINFADDFTRVNHQKSV